MQLTLDGMVRALRLKAFDMGDDHRARLREAEERNETVLALLAAESRRASMEAGDELRR
jgi:hypothetical protein